MGMTNAERQRKFRANRDRDYTRRQAYLEAGNERYRKAKETGKKKSTKELNERERRQLRRKWKKQKRELRAKQKSVKKIITPPMSPMSPLSPMAPNKAQKSRQKRQSQKKNNQEKSKCYRDNEALKLELKKANKLAQMYKQRWLRTRPDVENKETPRSKTRRLIRNISKKTARRTLLFQSTLVEQMSQWYKNKPRKDKKDMASMLFSGAVLRKYKFISHARFTFGVKTRRSSKNSHHTYLSLREGNKIRSFFERDDISRVMTGSKQTVTYKKEKKQRRVLLDSLRNTFLKYKSQTDVPMGFSTFCRLRPFWVVFPKPSDRNTCLCKLCENTQFLANSLKKAEAVTNDDLHQIIRDVVCDETSHDCMFGQCQKCKNQRIEYDKKTKDDTVQWFQWATKKEKRTIKQNNKTIEKEILLTVKDVHTGLVCDLVQQFEEDLDRYKKHCFNIRHQFMYFKERKENLKENECVIHIDFSENYVCKLANEIHSMHFGANKKQLSLHTGVYFCKHQEGPQTFCTVSENLDHSPGAIWVHLRPILEHVKRNHPNVDTLHIFSDGPTTQYRQKGNFLLLSQKPAKFGFTSAIWNFFESGHGKGTPDAVGGAIKRKADTHVKYGKDITSAKDFVDTTRESDTHVELIPHEDIVEGLQEMNQMKPIPIKGTLKIHQIFWLGNPGLLFHRNHSCICQAPNECSHHKLSTHLIESISDDTPSVKQNNFDEYLKKFHKCKSFTELKEECKRIAKTINDIEITRSISLPHKDLKVDEPSVALFPDDLDDDRELYPCSVKSDGNCLPSVGSVYAYGTTDKTSEMRVRIVAELALNENLYLDKHFLQKGRCSANAKNWPKIYAQYSDMFVKGTRLTDDIVRDIFRFEVMKIRVNHAFMGIWQVHALASVLKTPLYSVYPKLGAACCRKDLQRVIMPRPRQLTTTNTWPLYVLWTTTRNDMNNEHWIPNHFVAVLVKDNVCSTEAMKLCTEGPLSESTEAVKLCTEGPLPESTEAMKLCTEGPHPEAVLPSPEAEKPIDGFNYINQYVVVSYDDKPYPGFVEDANEGEVFVECMHRIGRESTCNKFSWPKKLKDKCWYELDKVIATIPPPAQIENSSLFQVDPAVWSKITT